MGLYTLPLYKQNIMNAFNLSWGKVCIITLMQYYTWKIVPLQIL